MGMHAKQTLRKHNEDTREQVRSARLHVQLREKSCTLRPKDAF